MLTLPFRSCPRYDLQRAMIAWLDSTDMDFVASEMMDDLLRLDTLRNQLSMSTNNTMELSVLKEYHACLLAFQKINFPDETLLRFEWMGAFCNDVQVHSSLSGERAAVLWNSAALESHAAAASVADNFADKRALSKAVKHWQSAASLIHHLVNTLAESSAENTLPGMDMSPAMLLFWENVFAAQGQMCGYYMAAAGGKPKHLLLAKLAIAAVPLMKKALEACRDLEAHVDTKAWVVYLNGWALLMEAKAEHHESITSKAKENWGMELARLEKALTVAHFCQEMLHLVPQQGLHEYLRQSLNMLLGKLTERYEIALGNNAMTYHQEIPSPHDVRPIRGEFLAKGIQSLPNDYQTLKTPMFTNMMGDMARSASIAFRKDMEALVHAMSQQVKFNTKQAKMQLASVNLPRSLTAYKQEHAGGGIPMDLWERVEAIQNSNRMSQLKMDLWKLRDVAEQARLIYKQTKHQLGEDLELDSLFREQHPDFVGHDVNEEQEPFRKSLQKYESLLQKSEEGDSILLKRLKVLDSDPKYRLLQFDKSHLDRLLPATAGDSMINTLYLSRLLAELSAQFRERDDALKSLINEVNSCNISGILNEIDENSPTARQQYQEAIFAEQQKFSVMVNEIQSKLEQQKDLLDRILEENERFEAARDVGASFASANTCIIMIEDALDEIEVLSDHLRDGNNFYQVVTPKLEQLQQLVGDASVRLTVDRCDYEDSHQKSASRRQQEIDDARMAQSLAGGSSNLVMARNLPHPQENPNNDIAPDILPRPSVPGAVNISHDDPRFHVDDEKVAALVAMDFDMDRVVAALKEHDNNVEQALNELLSG